MTPPRASSADADAVPVAMPPYLAQTYWWAYLHPNAVRVFERQWLVNLILWGNFARLRDAALAELGQPVRGNVLQVACVYGDFTPQLARRLAPDAHLSVAGWPPFSWPTCNASWAHTRR